MEGEGVKQRGVSAFVSGFLPANELSLPHDIGFCFWKIVVASNLASKGEETNFGPLLLTLPCPTIGGDQIWSSAGKLLITWEH